MRWLFVAIGGVAFAYLLVKMVPSYRLSVPPPAVQSFGGVDLSPEALSLLEQTKETALQLVERQNRWQRVALWAGFVSLAATAAATIWAGLRSRESRTSKEEFLNKKITGIGALTAVATLATAGGDLATSAGVKPLDAGIAALKTALLEVPAEIAAEPAAERRILDALEITLREYQS